MSNRLLSHAHARQLAIVNQAEAAAAAVDLAIARVWGELLRVLRSIRSPWEAHHAVHAAMRGLDHRMVDATAGSLRRIADTNRERTVKDIMRTVPAAALAHAALHKTPLIHHVRLAESLDIRPLREDLIPQQPGALSLFTNRSGNLGVADLLRFLRSPGDMSRTDQFDLFRQILFPSPPESAVQRIVYGDSAGGFSWVSRLQAATRLATPQHVASVLTTGYAAGKTQQQIAKDLLPIVQNVRSSARRIARTEGMRIAGDVQLACHDQLGDLVVGYQVHATLDQWTRPWHRARDGAIYYSQPAAGQKGYRQMPRPPMEPEDNAERPAGTPREAWNCRCYLTPVLRDLSGVGSPRITQPLAAGAAAVADV